MVNAVIGSPIARIDGPAKVRGEATYAAEFRPDGLAHAALVLSAVPSGRITRIDAAHAASCPGVLAIVTHENAPRLPYHEQDKRPQVDPKAGQPLKPLQDDRVLFSGQPVAAVVAETAEQARAAAALVRVAVEAGSARTDFDRDRARPPSAPTQKAGRPCETERGVPEVTLSGAATRVAADYVQARQHHHAIELHATVAQWQDGHLTLWDKTQWVDNDRRQVADAFGLEEDQVRVVSPFVGGAFGSALRTWPHVVIAALVARVVGRPVRLELTRREQFTHTGFRPRTDQQVALGAAGDGALVAVDHAAWAQTSAYEEYAETTLDPPRQTYACANVRTRYRLVEMNTNTPCPMRAPGMATGLFAQEIAMDELAVALGIDPVELRLRNHADRDPDKELPWSSKELRACYREAAARFGWAERTPAPRSMRRDGMLVGYGMATTLYPSHRAAAHASIRLHRDGTAVLRSAASDMGPGTYTSMTQVAADTLGLPVGRVRFELGDTDFPQAPVHGGSITMASVGTAVQAACKALHDKLAALAAASSDGTLHGAKPADIAFADDMIHRRDTGARMGFGEFLAARGLDWLEAEGAAAPGDEQQTHSSAAFGAIFAEVLVDPDLGTVRVPRMVGAYDIGRVINPRIARSQCIGGMVGGLGMALMEGAEWDARFGRVMNANLAEYLVPVCADIVHLEAHFVPSHDTVFNPLGAKGVAEVAICGVAPAIANAVFHATGIRVREVPILPERLLGA